MWIIFTWSNWSNVPLWMMASWYGEICLSLSLGKSADNVSQIYFMFFLNLTFLILDIFPVLFGESENNFLHYLTIPVYFEIGAGIAIVTVPQQWSMLFVWFPTVVVQQRIRSRLPLKETTMKKATNRTSMEWTAAGDFCVHQWITTSTAGFRGNCKEKFWCSEWTNSIFKSTSQLAKSTKALCSIQSFFFLSV